MPADHLTLSSSKVSLSLVQGKAFFGEQSPKPSNLAHVPLGRRPLLLGLLGQVANPLFQRSDFFPGLPSFSREGRAFLPKLGRDLALLREFPLGRLSRSLLVIAGRPGLPLPSEERQFLQGSGLERLQVQESSINQRDSPKTQAPYKQSDRDCTWANLNISWITSSDAQLSASMLARPHSSRPRQR